MDITNGRTINGSIDDITELSPSEAQTFIEYMGQRFSRVSRIWLSEECNTPELEEQFFRGVTLEFSVIVNILALLACRGISLCIPASLRAPLENQSDPAAFKSALNAAWAKDIPEVLAHHLASPEHWWQRGGQAPSELSQYLMAWKRYEGMRQASNLLPNVGGMTAEQLWRHRAHLLSSRELLAGINNRYLRTIDVIDDEMEALRLQLVDADREEIEVFKNRLR